MTTLSSHPNWSLFIQKLLNHVHICREQFLWERTFSNSSCSAMTLGLSAKENISWRKFNFGKTPWGKLAVRVHFEQFRDHHKGGPRRKSQTQKKKIFDRNLLFIDYERLWYTRSHISRKRYLDLRFCDCAAKHTDWKICKLSAKGCFFSICFEVIYWVGSLSRCL